MDDMLARGMADEIIQLRSTLLALSPAEMTPLLFAPGSAADKVHIEWTIDQCL